ncbi:MAG: flagellar hook-associated protein FlgK [Bacteroidota bacterium]|nr:flagellar hook-associated protein FlgK [Bacteroidota bacterium]MDP4190180.1 flagellar hook-associated protein FlgK [Bacteroidota bacterium]MDP4193779.1 flagellar hook-associated protein FlgK [Bacteroidota bacterium]
MGISRVFDIASRSLGVYQRALDATSHNVANASNPDYTRSKVILATERAEPIAGGEWGSGVKVQDIQRIRMSLLDSQTRLYNSKHSDASKRSDVLSQVETFLSEPSDQGISKLTNAFFSSWDKLSSTPSSIPLRNDVIQAAQNLTTKIQNVYEGLTQTKMDLRTDLNDNLTELNNGLKNIQSLNRQIFEARSADQSVNDLLDSRDKAIDDLSKLANLSIGFDDKGNANISIGGAFAVDGSNYSEFKSDVQNGQLQITTSDGSAKVTLNSGELYAITDLYTNTISGYQNKIDTFAQQIMTSVNQIHKQGYDLNATSATTSPNGEDFFSSYGSGILKINPNIAGDPSVGIASDPRKIAVSSNNQNGNGDIAVKLAQAASSKAINGQTISEYYSSLVSSIGGDKQLSDQNADSNQLVLDQLGVQKSSVSGVSVDEEMTNVIKFQRSYDASAKLIKVADEMLQTLINMV